MKKIISILLAFIMTISVFFSFETTALAGTSFETATSISTGYARCSIAIAGTTQYYTFSPSVTATYRFYSESDFDTYGAIYYYPSKNIIETDDNDGTGHNFYIERTLYSGNTYYLSARMYSSSTKGGFNVFVERVLSDTTKPMGSITVANSVTSNQAVTLTLSDNTGIAGYYWGANQNYNDNTYTSLSYNVTSKPKSYTAREYVTSSGVWYLTVRDTSGNVSERYQVLVIKTILNANGGSVSPSYVITNSGNSFTLPTPTRSNYFFNGWAESSSASSGVTGAYKPDTNKTLYAIWKLGMRTNINIYYGGQSVSTYFTPSESGVYDIYSSGDYDSYGYLYDNSSNEKLKEDDDDGDGNNFLIKRYLVAGHQYRVLSRMYSSSSTGSFTVTIEKSSCPHSNTSYIKTVSPTCTARGYSIYECDECASTINKNYTSAYGHNYITTTTKATTSKNGSSVTKCSRCSTVKSKSTIYYPKTITLSKTSYVYNGKAQKPSVTVKDSNGKTIASSNYTVSYPSGCKNVGKYTVTIKFKGNYSGTVKKTYTIKPKSTKFTRYKPSKNGVVTLNWKKVSNITGYEVQLSTKNTFAKNNTKTLNLKSSKTTTTGSFKSKKKYYIRIRTYKTVNGTKYYSAWSKTQSIKTK